MSNADEESLNNNAFFQHLQRSSVFDQACKKKYIIAIPPIKSLDSQAQFSRDFALSHILIRSSQRPQVYHTLASRTLILRDSNSIREFVTVSTRTTSWPDQRTVKVVSEETYYTENFESFPVIHISLPLIGHINQDYLKLIEAQTLSKLDPLQRGFNDHVNVLLTTLGDDSLTSLTQQTQSFLQGLKNGYILLRDFEQNLNEKIDLFCSTTLVGIISTLHNALPPLQLPVQSQIQEKEKKRFLRPKSPPEIAHDDSPPPSHHNNSQIDVNNIHKYSDGYPLTAKNWAEIIVAIEAFVMTKLSYFISRKLTELYHPENTLLYNASLWAQHQLESPNETSPNSLSSTSSSSITPTQPYQNGQDLRSIRRDSGHMSTMAQSHSISTNNFNQHTFTSSSFPSTSLIPTYLPTPNQQPVIPTPPQTFPLRSQLSSHLLPADHPFFSLIGLRPELAAVDFTEAAMILQQALSTVHYPPEDGALPVELFESGLSLQSQLFEVQNTAQRCVLNHYCAAINDDPLQSSMSFSAFTEGSSKTPVTPSSQVSAQPVNREDLSITAEDQIALFQYLLILRPSYASFSQLRYLSNFSPLEMNGMGYATNSINLSTNPASLVLPVSQLEMMAIALHGAMTALLQLYQSHCPQHAHILSHPDRPPSHINASVVRVNTQTLRNTNSHNYLSLPRTTGSRLDIFSGHGGTDMFSPISPRQNIRNAPGSFGSNSTNGSPPLSDLQQHQSQHQSQQSHVAVHADISTANRKKSLDGIDMNLIRKLEAEQRSIDTKTRQNATKGNVQNNDDDDDDFLSSLMKSEINSGQL